jgi:hypothetical protein
MFEHKAKCLNVSYAEVTEAQSVIVDVLLNSVLCTAALKDRTILVNRPNELIVKTHDKQTQLNENIAWHTQTELSKEDLKEAIRVAENIKKVANLILDCHEVQYKYEYTVKVSRLGVYQFIAKIALSNNTDIIEEFKNIQVQHEPRYKDEFNLVFMKDVPKNEDILEYCFTEKDYKRIMEMTAEIIGGTENAK